MACFDNLISLRELCTVETPTSGYYLNDIQITKKEIEDVITKDFTSVQDFIDQKSAFAINKVTSQIYSHLSPRFKADSILTGARIGFEVATKELVTQSGYVGIEVKVSNNASYIDFVISDLSLFVDVTATVPVLIYDLKQGKLLDTINVDTTAGQVSVSYQKSVISAPRKEMHLWIGYDANAINSYKTITHNGCSDCHGFTFNHKFIRATGASATAPFTAGTISPLTHTGGISFNYSVACNHKDWLCNHRDILGIPFLLATGIEIVNHSIFALNQRTMSVTTINRELLEQKLIHYTSELEITLGGILKNMSVPQDRNCFHCEQRIVSRTTLP